MQAKMIYRGFRITDPDHAEADVTVRLTKTQIVVESVQEVRQLTGGSIHLSATTGGKPRRFQRVTGIEIPRSMHTRWHLAPGEATRIETDAVRGAKEAET